VVMASASPVASLAIARLPNEQAYGRGYRSPVGSSGPVEVVAVGRARGQETGEEEQWGCDHRRGAHEGEEGVGDGPRSPTVNEKIT